MFFYTVAFAAALSSAIQTNSKQVLILQLDKKIVVVGQEVVLSELVPVSQMGRVTVVYHDVFLLSHYDATTDRMVDEIIPLAQQIGTDQLFSGFLWAHQHRDGFDLKADGFGRKGITYRMKPSTPGVYKLRSEWRVEGQMDRIHSTPIKLTVNPAPNASDKVADEIAGYEKQRSEDVQKLILIATTNLIGDDDTEATIAIRKLGVMRAFEAVPFLVKHLEFSPKSAQRGKRLLGLEESLPCVYALGQIGSPGIDELLKRVAIDDKKETVHYSGIVLKMSLGCDDAIALVRARAVNEKDAAVVKRLLALADWIDKRERATSYK